MASTLTLKSDGYGGRILRLYCTQTKDISSNKSKISWTLYSEGGSVNYYSTGPTTVKINGTQVYYKERADWTTYEFPAAKGSVSGSIYVSHNSNGSKSITVELSTAIYYGSVNSYTSNWTLDSIPRKATVTSLANFNDTENPVIYFDNPGGFKLKPILQIYNDDYTLAYKLVRSKGSYSSPYTFTLSDSERTEMRNATNKQSEYTITYVGLETYNGDESLGISNGKATYSIINANPVVSMTVSVNNGSLPSKFNGLWIQEKSRANVSLEATGVYNASIKSYYANVDGKTYNSQSFTSDVILNSGTRTVYGYAKDSRNLVGSESAEISVQSYSKPLVIPIGTENSILCYRSDGNGVRVGNSTSVWIKAKRNYSNITSEGIQLNLCALQWRRKLSSESWNDTVHLWSDLISSSSTTTDEYSALIADTVFDLTESYTIQIRAIDDIGEYDVKTLDIPTQDVAIHLGKGGKNVSVGKYCDYSRPYSFQCEEWDSYFGDVYSNGNKLYDFVIGTGTEEATTERGETGTTTDVGVNVLWNYIKWNSGRSECWCKYSDTLSNYADAVNGWYPYYTRIKLPSGLFISDPIPEYTCKVGNTLSMAGMARASSTQITCYAFANSGGSFVVDFYIHVTGNWK